MLSSLDVVDLDTYVGLHSTPMVDLNIDIDLNLFNQQVEQAKNNFQPWGINPDKKNRYGLTLTDPDKQFSDFPDPGNWPLDIWTYYHPNDPLCDATIKNPNRWYYHFTSLRPVYDLFDDHICRTNITWWDRGGEFHPHIDCTVDRAINYRIWMSNKTGEDHHLRFATRDTSDGMVNLSNSLKPGRLYLLDTSVYHNGFATVNNVYTMLMSLQPTATHTLKNLMGI